MVPSFVIPPGVSPDEVARKRAISEKLMMQGLQSQPQTIGDGLGSIADMLLARGYHEASKRDSERMNEVGQQAVNMWMGGGGGTQPATPQESYMPDGVSVAQMAPPPGASGGNAPGVVPNVQPYNPQPSQTGIQVDQVAARRAFRNLTDDELLSNLMNPQLVQATEWLNPEIPKIAREELSRRWDYLTEQQKQEFQLYMQDRGFDQQTQQQLRGFEHDRGMVGLRSRSELESEAIKQGYGSVEEMQAAGGTRASQKAATEVSAAQNATMASARSGIDVLTTLESLYNDEGVADIAGPINQTKPTFLLSEGGNRALTKHNQVQGQAFLEAFERLKGGGPITDIEGKKGTEAIQRIARALTEREYRAAVQEFAEITRGITKRRLAAAGVPEDQWPAVVRYGLQQGAQQTGSDDFTEADEQRYQELLRRRGGGQ